VRRLYADHSDTGSSRWILRLSASQSALIASGVGAALIFGRAHPLPCYTHSIEDECDGAGGILIDVVVSEPQCAPSMRAYRFLRDTRSSGLFNPVSLCRAISQRLPEPASRRTTGPEDRKQSCAREKRNPAPSRDVFGHDRPKSLEGGIVLYLDHFAIFPCPAETGGSLPAPVDQERGLPG
jgi:hypothetical protein